VSYLLEALKRLEEKRSGDRVSDLLASQGEVRRERKNKFLWPYILSVALLANAAVAAWWIAPWRGSSRLDVTQPSATQRESEVPAAKPPITTPAAQKTSIPSDKAKPESRPQENGGRKAPIQVQEASSERPVDNHPGGKTTRSDTPVESLPATPRTPSRPQAPSEGKPRADGRVLAMSELPAAVRNELPELKISLHSFGAEPRTRLVRINDKTLGEGDALPGGTRVEEITPDGVVLNHEGYRFRIGVEQGR
jgi:general secretion pathway protein B